VFLLYSMLRWLLLHSSMCCFCCFPHDMSPSHVSWAIERSHHKHNNYQRAETTANRQHPLHVNAFMRRPCYC